MRKDLLCFVLLRVFGLFITVFGYWAFAVSLGAPWECFSQACAREDACIAGFLRNPYKPDTNR